MVNCHKIKKVKAVTILHISALFMKAYCALHLYYVTMYRPWSKNWIGYDLSALSTSL